MKFDVLGCVETPKGLIVSLDVDEEGRQYLLERGFNALINTGIKNLETPIEECKD